jgi:transposase
VDAASEVVVVGDGAHWIWNLAALHFPDATQIVDWYHASQYGGVKTYM